jgi:hypothetical protein
MLVVLSMRCRKFPWFLTELPLKGWPKLVFEIILHSGEGAQKGVIGNIQLTITFGSLLRIEKGSSHWKIYWIVESRYLFLF